MKLPGQQVMCWWGSGFIVWISAPSSVQKAYGSLGREACWVILRRAMKQKRNPAHCFFYIPHNNVRLSALCFQTLILVIALPAHKCLNTSCCVINEYGIGVFFSFFYFTTISVHWKSNMFGWSLMPWLNATLSVCLCHSRILWSGFHLLLPGGEAAVLHRCGSRAQLAPLCHGAAPLQCHDDCTVTHLRLQTPLAR